jgi:hypothetical protein
MKATASFMPPGGVGAELRRGGGEDVAGAQRARRCRCRFTPTIHPELMRFE